MYGGDWLQTKAPLGFGLLGISSSVHCVSSKMNTGTAVRDRWTCQVRDTLCSGSDVSSLGHKERHSTRGDTRGDTVQGGTQGETQCKGGHKERHKEGHKGRHKARAQFVSVAQPCLSPLKSVASRGCVGFVRDLYSVHLCVCGS